MATQVKDPRVAPQGLEAVAAVDLVQPETVDLNAVQVDSQDKF